MNQFVRLAQAPAIAVVFASVFGGCATPESDGRATVLSLPYGQLTRPSARAGGPFSTVESIDRQQLSLKITSGVITS